MVEATFTNDDAATNRFDPGSVELVISDALNINTDAMAVTKSTIPVGHKNRYDKKCNRACCFLFRALASRAGVKGLPLPLFGLLWAASMRLEK